MRVENYNISFYIKTSLFVLQLTYFSFWRIYKEISQYILRNFQLKTHRRQGNGQGFNAMFAVSSVDAAKRYYETLNELQKDSDEPLRIATIYSFAPNEEQNAIGDIQDENFEPTALDSSAKEFLVKAINDYNSYFKTNFGVDSREFQNYYQDLAKRVKNKEIDLLIVVGMFLTGFDAPTLNTLFVDKNLRYHGLIQAYSRTNRIYDATKTFGNIVTFRNLEQDTVDAIRLFGEANGDNIANVVLERSYDEYLNGFTDTQTGESRQGYIEIVSELKERFPDPADIQSEHEKKEFVKLFSKYLRVENVLQNYDEFTQLAELQKIDKTDPDAIKEFKDKYFLTDETVSAMKEIEMLPERAKQDYQSTYNDIREWLKRKRKEEAAEKSKVSWDDVVFEVDLLKSQEIDLDYILELLFEHHQKNKDKNKLIEEMRRIIRSSIGNRAKEDLIIDFINDTNLDTITDKASVLAEFYAYAQRVQEKEVMELIAAEGLNEEAAKRYIQTSLEHQFASENGTDLNAALPKMSPLNPNYLTKKQEVLRKISAFVEKFKNIGGEL